MPSDSFLSISISVLKLDTIQVYIIFARLIFNDYEKNRHT